MRNPTQHLHYNSFVFLDLNQLSDTRSLYSLFLTLHNVELTLKEYLDVACLQRFSVIQKKVSVATGLLVVADKYSRHLKTIGDDEIFLGLLVSVNSVVCPFHSYFLPFSPHEHF